MATKEAKSPAPRRQWPPAERRRIVELTLRAGASVVAVARENGVNPNNVHRWKALYQAGKLDAQVKSARSFASPADGAALVPVSVVPTAPSPQPAARPDPTACHSGIVQLVLASGATLRIETSALDTALVCALVAELRR
jgi:transposase-like protein